MKRELVLLICCVLLDFAKHGQSFELKCENEGFAVLDSDNCASYYYCVRTVSSDFYAVKFECPLGEEFSLLRLKCIPQEVNECGKLPETPIDDPMLLDEFVCPSSGRFPDFESPDCKSYYMCSSELVPVLNNCPSTAIFSWESMKCVMPDSFTCPNAISTTTEPLTTTTETPTTTTEENTDPDSFVCKSEGRFADPQSTDCKSYYLCAKTADGTVGAILSQCPSTTIFSPGAQKCVVSSQYECPTTTSTTETTTATTSEKTSSGTSDPTEITEPSSVESSTSSTIEVTTQDSSISETTVTSELITSSYTTETENEQPDTDSTSETTTEHIGATTSHPASFICTGYGRFPDPESPDCKRYYLCTEDASELFTATLNQCPSITIFHPEKAKCVNPTEYECSVVETTTSELAKETSTIEITVPSSIAPTFTVPDASTAMYTTDLPIPTTDMTTTNTPSSTGTEEPTSNPPGESFVCFAYGRFPDPKSTDCKGYYLCTEDSSGFFTATLNQCPSVTIFHPDKAKCVNPTDYQCSAVETTTLDLTEETSTVETTVPSTISPTVTVPESSTATDLPIPTTDITTTNAPSSSGTDETTTNSPGESFVCFAYGRFPDPESTDCKSYYLCTEDSSGLFTATLNQCPSITIFHPDKAKCVNPTEYQCSVEITTSELTEETSTAETTVPSSEPTTVTPTELSTPVLTTQAPPPSEPFVCPDVGRFPDPTSADCKDYYLCSTTATGAYEAIRAQCPSITIFSAEQNRCVLMSQYQCPTATTTTTAEPSTQETTVSTSPTDPAITSEPTEEVLTVETTVPSSEPTTVSPTEPSTPVLTTQAPPPKEPFVCTAVGRYPDPTSADCKDYYLCSTSATGSYEAVRTQCPSITIFSADQNRCVLASQYQCPTAITTTTVKPSTQEITVPTSPTDPSTTTSSGNFVCTSIGRHPDSTQPGCSQYKYCLLTATNEFLEYTFNCPSGTYFNPRELRCSTGYSCPPPILTPTVGPEHTTELLRTTTPFYCTSDGRFPDRTSEGCDTYIVCLRTAVGGFQRYNFKCPSGSRFSPAEAKCSTSYSCM